MNKIMNKKMKKNSMIIIAAMTTIVMLGSIYFAPIKGWAAHQAGCDRAMYYKGVISKTSSYTHNSQYGSCTVSVTELFDYYECKCGAENSSSRIERREVHSQPHG